MTSESTVLEKLFHDDHPMGGRGTGICLAAGAPFAAELPFVAMTAVRVSPKSNTDAK
jgi:hypothetical protein